jgi:hypothetical protein
MFGLFGNSIIAIVLKIEIVMVHPNTNLLFRNNENNYYSVVLRESWNIYCFLNSPLLLQIYNSNNIFIIWNGITFLLPHANVGIIMFFTILILLFSITKCRNREIENSKCYIIFIFLLSSR